MTHILFSPLYLIASLWAVYTVAYIGIKGKGILDRNKVRRALFALPDVPDADKAAAWKDMEAAFKADLKTLPYDYSAPLVVAIALIGLPETARTLPQWARKWNNNVSVNGDAQVVRRGGEWVTLRNGNEALPGEVVLSYDDLAFDGYAYYKCFGLRVKPRSYLGRWTFAGVRNRASALSQQLGCEVTEYPQVLSGARNLDRGTEGHFLLRAGSNYHFKSVTKTRIAGRDWAVIRSCGHKLEISMMHAGGWGRAAAVAIGWSAKGWKEKKNAQTGD